MTPDATLLRELGDLPPETWDPIGRALTEVAADLGVAIRIADGVFEAPDRPVSGKTKCALAGQGRIQVGGGRGLARRIAAEDVDELQRTCGNGAVGLKRRQPVHLIGGIENVLDSDARLGAVVEEGAGQADVVLDHNLAQGDRDHRGLHRCHQRALLGRRIAAHGLGGDLHRHSGHGARQLRHQFGIKPGIQHMLARAIADMGMEPIRASRKAFGGAGHDLGDGHGQGRVVGLTPPGAVRGHHDPGQAHAASAPRIAPDSLPTSSSIWVSSMMKGGASRMWSPRWPSMVPPIG